MTRLVGAFAGEAGVLRPSRPRHLPLARTATPAGRGFRGTVHSRNLRRAVRMSYERIRYPIRIFDMGIGYSYLIRVVGVNGFERGMRQAVCGVSCTLVHMKRSRGGIESRVCQSK